MGCPSSSMAWRNSTRWLAHLEEKGELLRISEPVDVELEAGAIADRLVKTNGPAVLFEKPRLPNGEISEIPLAMNLFGSHDRTLRALGAAVGCRQCVGHSALLVKQQMNLVFHNH